MRYHLVLLAMAVLLAGCGQTDQQSDAHRRQVSGQFSMGDATHHFVATFHDSALVKLEERQQFGDVGEASSVYEVVDGRLTYYRCDEQRARTGADATGHEQVELELEFDTAGQVLNQRKLVVGAPTELVGYEAPGVQRHFAELRRRAVEEDRAALAGMR